MDTGAKLIFAGLLVVLIGIAVGALIAPTAGVVLLVVGFVVSLAGRLLGNYG